MNQMFLGLVGVLLSVLATGAALSQSADERRRLNELDATCYKARQEKIFEVQQQKIEECVKTPPAHRQARKSQDDCERYWGNYGWVMGNKSGGARPHLFADLPECVQAFEARKQAQRR
jgi:hypothetical protein